MGYRMAQNLLKNGKSLIAYDVATDPLQNLAKEGALVAASPREVCFASASPSSLCPTAH